MAYLTATDPGSREDFSLAPNYPNPFASTTRLVFSVPAAGPVRLTVLDVLGRTVAVLVDGIVGGGRNEVLLEAGDLAAGTYFCRLESGGRTTTRAIQLVR
jgi:hypothetical protein